MSVLNFHSVIMNVSSKESLYCHGDKGLFIKIIVVSLFREETAVMHRPLNCMLSALIVVFTSSGLVRPSPRQAVSGEATLQTTFFAICPSITIAICCATVRKYRKRSHFLCSKLFSPPLHILLNFPIFFSYHVLKTNEIPFSGNEKKASHWSFHDYLISISVGSIGIRHQNQ